MTNVAIGAVNDNNNTPITIKHVYFNHFTYITQHIISDSLKIRDNMKQRLKRLHVIPDRSRSLLAIETIW
jgi:hypothetical protein